MRALLKIAVSRLNIGNRQKKWTHPHLLPNQRVIRGKSPSVYIIVIVCSFAGVATDQKNTHPHKATTRRRLSRVRCLTFSHACPVQ